MYGGMHIFGDLREIFVVVKRPSRTPGEPKSELTPEPSQFPDQLWKPTPESELELPLLPRHGLYFSINLSFCWTS